MLDQKGLDLLTFYLIVKRANAWAIEATKIVVQNHNILSNPISRLPPLMLGTRSYLGKKK